MVKKKECKCHEASGLFIPAGLLIGLGIGFVYGQIPAGLLIGLGAGFILMGISKVLCKCK